VIRLDLKIDKNEVLRYLGYRGGEIDDKLNNLIDECIDRIIKSATLRVIYKEFNISNDMSLENTLYKFHGEDIKAHLSGCKKCVLMALTLGVKVEDIIRTAGISDMSRSVILDSCATAAAEQAADNVQGLIEKEYKGKFLTKRFSPGYGDMPIESQQDFAVLLDTARKIGLTVTKNNILLPRKSITAIIGISDVKTKGRLSGCKACLIKDKCNFRKEGRTCDIKR